MSICTRAGCPHERGVFVWLGDGPWQGDPADPDHGRYPWVHDTASEDARGHLEVCELMPFAAPEEAGEVCACGHSSGSHEVAPGPLPAGLLAKPPQKPKPPTVTFLPGVTPPDELAARRKAEVERREAGRCADPGCLQLPPNHLFTCRAGGDGPDGGAA
jgi:hypothetical protein